MSKLIPQLDNKGLRKFGLITSAIVVILFGVLLPWLFDKQFPVWPWWIAIFLIGMASLVPGWLAPIYKGWMRVGLLLGWVNTRIILGAVFFLLIFPLGIVMSIVRKDPMRRKFEPRINSYRVKKEQRTRIHVERPF